MNLNRVAPNSRTESWRDQLGFRAGSILTESRKEEEKRRRGEGEKGREKRFGIRDSGKR